MVVKLNVNKSFIYTKKLLFNQKFCPLITNQTERLNFASTKNIPDHPDFLDVQGNKMLKIFFKFK
jgi:hypothetical protein